MPRHAPSSNGPKQANNTNTKSVVNGSSQSIDIQQYKEKERDFVNNSNNGAYSTRFPENDVE
jgi:hypothetical protein